MKKLILTILLIAGFAAAYQFIYLPTKNKTEIEEANVKKIKVLQKVQGQSDFSSYEIGENKTALDLLRQTESAVTTGEKENAFVVGINGIKAEEEKREYWSMYVNGKASSLGAGSYKLKNGDKLEWKIENY